MQALDALEHHLHRCFHPFRAQHLGHLCAYLLGGERLVDASDVVGSRWLLLAVAVDRADELAHAALLYQSHCRTEGAQLLQMRHIYAVVVGIAYLRRARHHHDLLRVQAVEYLEDALAERRAAHNAVVNNHEIVLVGAQRAVAHVVHVGRKVVALPHVAYERAQLYVLPHHFLHPYVAVHLPHAVGHAIESHLCRVGNVGEHRVRHVAADGLADGRREQPAQLFALAVDVAVGASAEVDALEAALPCLLRRHNLFGAHLAAPLHRQHLPRQQFRNPVGIEVEARLYHRPFACHHHHFVVLIPEGRPYAPRVAHGKHLARACNAAHHVASVKERHRRAQHTAHLHVVVDVPGYVGVAQLSLSGLGIEALHFAVQTVAHQL